MSAPLTGIGVSPGTVAGPVARMSPPPQLPPQTAIVEDSARELDAAKNALEAVGSDLDARAAAAGGEAADVLFAQAMMARDPGLVEKITERVAKGETAPHAVSGAFEEYRAVLANAGAYMAERVADLDDIRTRAVATLLGLPMPGIPTPGHPFVLVAPDLAPADTATIDATQVLGIVTERGGPTSHTAILAKSLGLPAVVACPDAGVAGGRRAGAPGRVGRHGHRQPVPRRRRRSHQPGGTPEGRPGSEQRAGTHLGRARRAAAAQHRRRGRPGAGGRGRRRGRRPVPHRVPLPRPDQRADRRRAGGVYTRVFDAFSGRKVVVRTLDAGADKPLGFVTQPDEPNPALGIRGLRTSRRFPELLDDQLRPSRGPAAAGGTEVWVMAPMVSTAGEASAFAADGPRRGAAEGRRHGRGAGRGAAGPARGRRLRLPEPGHQRPRPVHLRRRPDGRRARRPARPVAAGAARPRRHGGQRGGRRPASRSACAARRPAIRCWRSSWSGWA